MKKFKWKKMIPHAKFGYKFVKMDRVQKHPPWWPSLCGTLRGTCQDCCTCFLEFGAVPKPTNTQSQDMPGMRFFDLQAIITRFALWLPIGFGLLVPISCIQRENSHLRIKSFPRFLLSPQSDKVHLGNAAYPLSSPELETAPPSAQHWDREKIHGKKNCEAFLVSSTQKNILFTRRCVSACEQVLLCAFRRVAHTGVQWKSVEGIQILTGVYTPNAFKLSHTCAIV